jgi:hypothetical protein
MNTIESTYWNDIVALSATPVEGIQGATIGRSSESCVLYRGPEQQSGGCVRGDYLQTATVGMGQWQSGPTDWAAGWSICCYRLRGLSARVPTTFPG